MKVLNKNSNIPQQLSLILGFFDGIHQGHRQVLANTPKTKKILVTFSTSPAEYFNKEFEYIYSREYNYKLLEKLGVDYVYEQKFNDIVNLSASDYLEFLVNKFNPISITSGFNHRFGCNRQGDSEFLEKNQKGFKYYSVPPYKINEEVVCSTKIKKFLSNGELEKANLFLGEEFTLKSTVKGGLKLGRKLGFPTANMDYPQNIVKIPYGVYKVIVLDKVALMNWGEKPTIGSSPLMEVFIPEFEGNLYGKELEIKVCSKIRDEKKFLSIEELKKQIEKDVETCLKL